MLNYSDAAKLIKVPGAELRQNYYYANPMLIRPDQLSASALCWRKSLTHKASIRQRFWPVDHHCRPVPYQ